MAVTSEAMQTWLARLLGKASDPPRMPLEEFLKGTMAALATDADEIMVPHAKFLRDQAGPNEATFVSSFNKQLEAPRS